MTADVNRSEELRAVIKRIEGLPEHDVESIVVLINAGEWRVALETLCTQIYEYDCDLSKEIREELLRLGRDLGVAAGYLLGDPWEEPDT